MEESDIKELKNELRKQWSISAKSPTVFKSIDMVTDFIMRNQKAFTHLKTLRTLSDESKTKRERNMLNLVVFLWIYEGLYLSMLDLFCAILVVNHHDLYIDFKYKFADSPSDIAKVQMDVKERFLEKHDFGAIIRRNDKDLRNKIAHHNFSFDEHDDVVIDGKPIEIIKSLNELVTFISSLNTIIAECFKQPQTL